jgi:hypothetical protein
MTTTMAMPIRDGVAGQRTVVTLLRNLILLTDPYPIHVRWQPVITLREKTSVR